VISGTPTGVERAGELAKERGAKRVLPLAVEGAFHSPLMAPAAQRLETELEATDIRACRITLYANVTAQPVEEPDDIRRALASQLKSPVRWRQSVTHMIEEAPRFIEVGPGAVLAGLMRRIHRESPVENLATVEALRKRSDV
jgi:[acyl-carrier-protein] S-malonyltransferase